MLIEFCTNTKPQQRAQFSSNVVCGSPLFNEFGEFRKMCYITHIHISEAVLYEQLVQHCFYFHI